MVLLSVLQTHKIFVWVKTFLLQPSKIFYLCNTKSLKVDQIHYFWWRVRSGRNGSHFPITFIFASFDSLSTVFVDFLYSSVKYQLSPAF